MNDVKQLLLLLDKQQAAMHRIPQTFKGLMVSLPNPAELDASDSNSVRLAYDSLTMALEMVREVAEDYAETARATEEFVKSTLPPREDI